MVDKSRQMDRQVDRKNPHVDKLNHTCQQRSPGWKKHAMKQVSREFSVYYL